jgi:hypothetical protein
VVVVGVIESRDRQPNERERERERERDEKKGPENKYTILRCAFSQ